MQGINPEEIAKRYNALDIIVDADDRWHQETEKAIFGFINKSVNQLANFEHMSILNAGSAGHSYGLNENHMLHVDVAERHITGLSNAIVADICQLPLDDQNFDLIICVGSVLNYCDPMRVFKEFTRVLKKPGYLILEFENSKTFELLFKKGYDDNAVFQETFFDAHGDTEKVWYFSERYIRTLLSSYGFTLINIKRFHLLSPLAYRLTGNQYFSAGLIKLDVFFRSLPWVRNLSSNVILLAKFT